MNGLERLIGAAGVLLFMLLTLFFSSKKIRVRFPAVFRKLRSVAEIRLAIGRAVEDGTRLHVSLGDGSPLDASNTSALIGIATLDRIEQLASTSDLPPMCTSGTGSFQILSQNISRQNLIESNQNELMDPALTQMAGVTPFSYAVGTMHAMNESGTSANVFVGHFGAEAGLLCEAAENNQSSSLGGSDSLIAQSLFYAAANETLIGEEIYALPAYLGYSPTHQASLRVQDFFRFILVLVLIGGSLLKLFGVL